MKFDVVLSGMKRVILVLLLSGLVPAVSAQMRSGLKFNKLVHNFGNIPEEIGTAVTVFSFRNTGKEPLFIVRVETSCGCTTPEYSKDTIQPGDTGYVKAMYDTRGRHGDFHKNLFVHFNKENDYQSLSISGNVIPEANLSKKPKTFTTTYSNLAFNSTVAEFPKLPNTQKQTYLIKAYNYQGYPIRIYDVSEKPDFVQIDIGDSLIGVNDSITITIVADGSKVGMLGEVRRRIVLYTDDPGAERKFLYVYTNVHEDFSHLSKKELKNAPRLQLDQPLTIQLGKHSAGEKFKHVLTITNTGKSELKLRDIVPNCSCISFSLAKQSLAPGESVQLVLSIDTVNQTIAGHTKYISIYSNDPSRPELRLKVLIDITN